MISSSHLGENQILFHESNSRMSWSENIVSYCSLMDPHWLTKNICNPCIPRGLPSYEDLPSGPQGTTLARCVLEVEFVNPSICQAPTISIKKKNPPTWWSYTLIIEYVAKTHQSFGIGHENFSLNGLWIPYRCVNHLPEALNTWRIIQLIAGEVLIAFPWMGWPKREGP